MIAAPPAAVALSVAPAHVELPAGGRATIRVRSAERALTIRATVAGLALDQRGRPTIAARRDAAAWLVVRPRAGSVARHGASFVIGARSPAHARPGDHTAVLLLTAVAPRGNGVAAAIRIGLVVTVRVAGRAVRRIDVVSAHARPSSRSRGRMLSVVLANRGDVIESVGGSALEIAILRRGRVLARLRGPRRKLLPRTTALVTFRLPPALHGAVVARVAVAQRARKGRARSFPLRL